MRSLEDLVPGLPRDYTGYGGAIIEGDQRELEDAAGGRTLAGAPWQGVRD